MATEIQKRTAREAVKRAVRSGRLIKPKACEECGSTSEAPHAHHSDYSKPLAVEWLCRECHGFRHLDAGDMEPSQLTWAFSRAGVVDAFLPPWTEGGEDADYVAWGGR